MAIVVWTIATVRACLPYFIALVEQCECSMRVGKSSEWARTTVSFFSFEIESNWLIGLHH